MKQHNFKSRTVYAQLVSINVAIKMDSPNQSGMRRPDWSETSQQQSKIKMVSNRV